MEVYPDFDQDKFFLGSPCKRGHVWGESTRSLRYKSTHDCIDCLRVRYKPGQEPPKIGRLTAEQVAEICQRYPQGENLYNLAKRFRVSPAAIHYHLRKHGVPLRSSSDARRPIRSAEALREEREAGSSKKRCNRCGEIKPKFDFFRARHISDGVEGTCKACKGVGPKPVPFSPEERSARARQSRAASRARTRLANKDREIDPNAPRTCTACKRQKTNADFYRDHGVRDGVRSICRDCALPQRQRLYWNGGRERQMARLDERLAQDPEHYRRRYRSSHIKIKFGLTWEEYQALLRSQAYACAICHGDLSKKDCIDHCHKTGVIRGILCDGCNVGIGRLRDDPNLCEAAARYLRTAQNGRKHLA